MTVWQSILLHVGKSCSATRVGRAASRQAGWRMADADYFVERAHQELKAAMQALDLRVRQVHLQLADAYAFRSRELNAQERRSQMQSASEASLPLPNARQTSVSTA